MNNDELFTIVNPPAIQVPMAEYSTIQVEIVALTVESAKMYTLTDIARDYLKSLYGIVERHQQNVEETRRQYARYFRRS